MFENVELALKEGDMKKAISICMEKLKGIETGSDDSSAAKDKVQVLFKLADLHDLQDKWFDSLMYLDQARTLASKKNLRGDMAEALVRTGELLIKSGKWDKALGKFKEAEKNVSGFENKLYLGRAIVGKSYVFWRTGQSYEAIEHGKKALEIGMLQGDYGLVGKAASVISSVRFELGEFDMALITSTQSVDAYMRVGNKTELARVLNNQGEIYKVMNDYEKAIKVFEDGLNVLKGMENNRAKGYFYNNLAECNLRLGKNKLARDFIGKADEVLAGSEDKYAAAYLLMVKGMIEDAKGNGEKGRGLLEKAANRMENIGIPYDTGLIKLEHARSFHNSGMMEKAKEKAEEALKAFEEAGSVVMKKSTIDFIDKL